MSTSRLQQIAFDGSRIVDRMADLPYFVECSQSSASGVTGSTPVGAKSKTSLTRGFFLVASASLRGCLLASALSIDLEAFIASAPITCP